MEFYFEYFQNKNDNRLLIYVLSKMHLFLLQDILSYELLWDLSFITFNSSVRSTIAERSLRHILRSRYSFIIIIDSRKWIFLVENRRLVLILHILADVPQLSDPWTLMRSKCMCIYRNNEDVLRNVRYNYCICALSAPLHNVVIFLASTFISSSNLR